VDRLAQPVLPRAPRAAAWALAVAAVHAASAQPAGAQQATTGTVAGRVTGDDGAPLANVGVSVVGTTNGTLTRGDGTFRITVRPGQYELRARLIGYGLGRETVSVAAGATATANFRLARAASALDAVAVVGTRSQPRTAVESPVPVDVLSTAEIRSTGRTETAQILQQLAPSVNFPRATISDGTDAVRPATLRGLGADQVLVLVNGKRRHTSALVNVNGSIGRGQAAVDLNAIPASMIDRIEVLRDGAAAQYGSDAIAGVINIVLKSGGGGELTSTVGQTNTTYGGQTVTNPLVNGGAGVTTPSRSANDGGVVQVGLNGGVARAPNRFFHAGGEYRYRGYTNRTLGDPRPQTFADVSSSTFFTSATGRINHRQGDAETRDAVGFFNGGATAGAFELYAFGGFSRRGSQSAGFFRRANDDRTIRQLYPDGFLPLIGGTLYDASTFAGARTQARGWRVDLSTGVGGNSFRFDIENTNNVSLGTASGTEFYAGTLVDRQFTTNLDAAREDRVGNRPVRTAVGAEFRVDQYRILAGEPGSYQDGGVRVLNAAGAPTTRIAAPGAQVFPGFRAATATSQGDATRQQRNNVSLYADVEADVTPRWLVNGALRFENYSDFGATTNGKLASRFNVARGIVVRGAASTGFRAPSLQQSYYSAVATNFIGGVPFEVGTFPVNSPVARLLGSTDLKAEKSVNLSAGLALEPVRNLSLTVDLYRIGIKDRVVLSENFTGDSVRKALAGTGASGARYFTNAIDTRTNGVDVVGSYGLAPTPRQFLRLTAGYNHNQSRATRVSDTPAALAAFRIDSLVRETLFGRVERSRLEVGQPRDNLLGSASYDVGAVNLTARAQRFGEVTALNPVGSERLDQTFGAKWISDLSASLRLARRFTITAGADNVFDVYPDQNNDVGDPRVGAVGVTGPAGRAGNANFGIFPYNQISPFGFNGRFLYTRVTLAF
jgi:iron complex outermembrane receptor protein